MKAVVVEHGGPIDNIGLKKIPRRERDVLVTTCGRLCSHRKKINISVVLAGQKLGIDEVDEGI